MKLTLLLLLLSQIPLTANASPEHPETQDPYARISSTRLRNGIKVILSPSPAAKTLQVKVEVRAGHFNEATGKAGVAHLLEHYLFTDAKLERSMTYLEVIKEKGGSGNAMTSTKKTVYYATVPSREGNWLVDVMTKILFKKTFDDREVAHAKGPVFLEIGRPTVFDHLTNLIQRLKPDFVHAPDLWELEFGVREPDYKVVAHRLDTDGLTAADLTDFYQRYYHPGNLTVFVAGAFEPQAMLRLLEKKMGTEPPRSGSGWVDPDRKARRGEYLQTEVTTRVPYINLGTKVTGVDLVDETAGRIYVDYLRHRLMKTLRNQRGETYTVHSDANIRMGAGTLSVGFQAPRERFRENLKLARDLIEHEAQGGQITEEMFSEAVKLYRQGFERLDPDSDTMMKLAERWDWKEINYPAETAQGLSDYGAIAKLDRVEFVRRLKRLFAPDMKLQELEEPPLFFRYDTFFFLIAGFGAWMVWLRRLLARPFRHDQVRWIRKLSHPPAYLTQAGAFGIILLLSSIPVVLLEGAWAQSPFFRSSIIMGEYLATFLLIGPPLVIAQGVLALFARKVLLVGDRIYIKSLGYHSESFLLSEVKHLELRSRIGIRLSLKERGRIKYRFYDYDFCFWRRGLRVELTDGRAYFLGFRDSAQVLAEWNGFLTQSGPIALLIAS